MSGNSREMGQLTPHERIVLDMIEKAARLGKDMPSNIAIKEALGVSSISTASTVVGRLEHKGIIVVKRFTSQRQVEIPSLQIQTAGPRGNPTPRLSTVQTPSVEMLTSDDPNLTEAIRREAAARKMHMQDFLMLLVRAGWDVIQQVR